MSDNLCGPSTALKSFSEHVNRDRSVHQDRAAPGRAGPSNFRSATNGTNSNEAEVRAFTSGASAAFQAEPMQMGPDMNGYVHPVALQQMGPHHPQAHQPQARFAGPGVVPGHGNASWAAEFASSPSTHSATTAAPSRPSFVPQQPLQAVNRLQHFSSGMMVPGPAFVPMAHPAFVNHNNINNGFAGGNLAFQAQPNPASSSYAPPVAVPTNATASATMQPATTTARAGNAPSGVAGLTEAELEARFAQAENEFDFQDEMDSWMQAHGPTGAERGEARTEDVDAILESLADELDAQKLAESAAATPSEEEAAAATQAETDLARDQDDLARTAGQIVNTLDSHPSVRFQESSFMRLMKRIQIREVTVKGDNLVDETTGLPIEVVVQETPDQATA